MNTAHSFAKSYKGAVLAAGFGTRLKPLTLTWPKPLIPIFGSHPLEMALHSFAKFGISEVAVNGHYLAKQVADYLEHQEHIQNYRFFYEPQILGTGGAYNPMRSWLGDSQLIVINGDVLIDIDLAAIIKTHEAAGAQATMALLPKPVGQETRVHFDGRSVQGFSKDDHDRYSNHCFALVQILSPDFLDLLPKEGCFDIVSRGYQVALQKGWPVAGYLHHGYWRDIGSPRALLSTVQELASDWKLVERLGLPECWRKNGFLGFLPYPPSTDVERAGLNAGRREPKNTKNNVSGVLCEHGSKLGDGVVLGNHVYIAAGADIGTQASLSHCLVLPGAKVAAHSKHVDTIFGPSFSVPVDHKSDQ